MIDPVAEARAKKESASVSFARFLEIRAASPEVAIAAVEGRDDTGVWSVWFVRCGLDEPVEILPCSGKEKVFELRDILARNRRERTDNVKFFIDRDYDDWAGHRPSADVFMTDRYSIENYFVCDRVLDHVLNIYFLCTANPAEKQPIKSLFYIAFDNYRAASDEIQKRTYCRRKLEVKKGETLPSKIKDIVDIVGTYSFSPSVDCSVDEPECGDLVTLDAYRQEFSSLPFLERARGKYHRAFLQYFFQSLQEERPANKRNLFPVDKPETSFKYSSLNLNECAGVSPIPTGLKEFVEQHYACVG